MTQKSTEYEEFVLEITEALLRAQGLETVTVRHDEQVQGMSRSHQIDVYWEYRLGGISHRVIINCKRYRSTVEVTDVETLNGVLADMPGVRGLLVTTVGFQKGAVDYAKVHKIGLKVIRPPQDDDWEGRIREVQIGLRLDVPELIACKVGLNLNWIKENIPGAPSPVASGVVVDARSTTVLDLRTGSVSDMNALWNRAMQENPTDAESEGVGVVRWEDARFQQPGKPPLRIDEIEFRWRIRQGQTETIKVRHDPAAIVRDAIEGTLLFVDPDGTVTGDVEEELGRPH